MLALYVTHPEVVIDPAVPSTEWRLSPDGRARAEAFAARSVLPRGAQIVASTERKTMETAAILSGGTAFESGDAFRENKRSTGVVAPDVFEALLDAMYARPDESSSGWETAHATQQRIVAAVAAALGDQTLPVVFVGHGSIGTFLKCHIARRPIARGEDQRIMAWPGGGNVFSFDWTAKRLVRDWHAMEDFAPAGV